MSTRVIGVVVAFLGILLIVFGAVLGNQKLQTDDGNNFNCGSAFSPAGHDSGNFIDAAIAKTECKAPIENRNGSVWGQIVVGILLTLGGAIALAMPSPQQSQKDAVDAEAALSSSARIAAKSGVAGELERLAQLHASGALSDEQFEQAKQLALNA